MEYYFSRKWFAVSTIMVYMENLKCYVMKKKKISTRRNGRESISNLDDQVMYRFQPKYF